MSYEKGMDCFFTKPGSEETMNCKVCGITLEVKRDCEGPTSWAGSMSGSKTKHDYFFCSYAEDKWHKQVKGLWKEMERCPSNKLSEIMFQEIEEILNTRKPTKLWDGFP